MSGTRIMLKPLPPAVAEASYSTIMKELGLENATVDEQIQRLLTIDPDELVAKTPMTCPLMPHLDGDMIPTAATFDKLLSGARPSDFPMPGRQWCSELMIGNCQHNVRLFISKYT